MHLHAISLVCRNLPQDAGLVALVATKADATYRLDHTGRTAARALAWVSAEFSCMNESKALTQRQRRKGDACHGAGREQPIERSDGHTLRSRVGFCI